MAEKIISIDDLLSKKIAVGESQKVVETSALEKLKPVKSSSGKPNLAGCTETIRYDENGEISSDTVRRQKSMNGSGFVISYTAKMCDFISTTKQGSVVRLFVYLAHNQQYGTDGKTFGYRCSHKYLQQVLSLDKKSIYNALQYLKENFLVLETREEGSSEFMVNPQYVTIGTDKKARLKVWNERWAQYWKIKESRKV